MFYLFHHLTDVYQASVSWIQLCLVGVGQRGRQVAVSASTAVCQLTMSMCFQQAVLPFCEHFKTHSDTAGADLLQDLATAPRATTNKTTQARSRRGSDVGTVIYMGQLLASRGTLVFF